MPGYHTRDSTGLQQNLGIQNIQHDSIVHLRMTIIVPKEKKFEAPCFWSQQRAGFTHAFVEAQAYIPAEDALLSP